MTLCIVCNGTQVSDMMMGIATDMEMVAMVNQVGMDNKVGMTEQDFVEMEKD